MDINVITEELAGLANHTIAVASMPEPRNEWEETWQQWLAFKYGEEAAARMFGGLR